MNDNNKNIEALLELNQDLILNYDSREHKFSVIDKTSNVVLGQVDIDDLPELFTNRQKSEITEILHNEVPNQTVLDDYLDDDELNDAILSEDEIRLQNYKRKLGQMNTKELFIEKEKIKERIFDLGDDLNGNNLSWRDLELALITGKDLDGIDVPNDTPEERGFEENKQKIDREMESGSIDRER